MHCVHCGGVYGVCTLPTWIPTVPSFTCLVPKYCRYLPRLGTWAPGYLGTQLPRYTQGLLLQVRTGQAAQWAKITSREGASESREGKITLESTAGGPWLCLAHACTSCRSNGRKIDTCTCIFWTCLGPIRSNRTRALHASTGSAYADGVTVCTGHTLSMLCPGVYYVHYVHYVHGHVHMYTSAQQKQVMIMIHLSACEPYVHKEQHARLRGAMLTRNQEEEPTIFFLPLGYLGGVSGFAPSA